MENTEIKNNREKYALGVLLISIIVTFFVLFFNVLINLITKQNGKPLYVLGEFNIPLSIVGLIICAKDSKNLSNFKLHKWLRIISIISLSSVVLGFIVAILTFIIFGGSTSF